MKTLYFTGPTWMFLTPEQMYGEEGKFRSAHKHYQNADIYFITKMRKVRFKAKKSGVTADGKIKVTVALGDRFGEHEEKTFVFPAVEVLYAMKHIPQHFATREHFFIHMLFHYYKPQSWQARFAHWLGRGLLHTYKTPGLGALFLKWAYAQEVRVTHKDEYEISITDPLARALTDKEKFDVMKRSNPVAYQKTRELFDADWDTEKLKLVDFEKLYPHTGKGIVRLTVDQVINYFQVEVGSQEIVYIGKTERQPFERLLPHEKLQELQAKFLRNDGEAIVVHLFGFKTFDVVLDQTNDSIIDASEAITTIEAELINYFKPIMNEKYVKDGGKKSWDHIRSLISQGYGEIVTLLDIDKQYTKFITDAVHKKNPSRHFFKTDLNSLRRGKLRRR